MIHYFRQLLRLIDRYKWLYFLSLALLFISLIPRTLIPKVLEIAVDYVILSLQNQSTVDLENRDFVFRFFQSLLPTPTMENFGWLLFSLGMIYFFISVSRGFTLLVYTALKTYCGENIAKDLRDRAFAKIQALPMAYFGKVSKGELIQRCTGDIDTIKNFVQNQIIALVNLSTLFLFTFVMMCLVNWQYALISVSILPLIAITAYFFFQKEAKVWQAHEAEADKLNAMVQENLNGIRVVSAFANEEYEIQRFDQQNQRKKAMGLRHRLLHTFYWPLSDAMAFAQIIIAAMAGGYFVLTGEITIGELLSFYTYVSLVVWPVRQIGQILSEMGMASVALDRVSEIMQAPEELEAEAQMIEPIAIKGDLVFENVSFKYKDEDENYVLKDLSFEIKAGQKVAIIGPTGAGKSTIIKLLLRLYEVNEGQIKIDGRDIQTISKTFLRSRIRVALQKAFLFSTTLKDNMAYAEPDSAQARVELAAQHTQAYEMVQKFPQGYETMVGEKGVTLSGGQKQRVALTRTILPQMDMLVLDDTTSAVDTETEHAIFDALKGTIAQKTTIIISHRITSIQQADMILVLDQGRLVQMGSPEALQKEPGYYQRIHAVQADLEEEIEKEISG